MAFKLTYKAVNLIDILMQPRTERQSQMIRLARRIGFTVVCSVMFYRDRQVQVPLWPSVFCLFIGGIVVRESGNPFFIRCYVYLVGLLSLDNGLWNRYNDPIWQLLRRRRQ